MRNGVRCSSCGTENEAGTKFCDACGTPLLGACPGCGATNRPTARFCAECGSALAGPVAAAAGPAGQLGPAAERRLVSVLFADLVGLHAVRRGARRRGRPRDPEPVLRPRERGHRPLRRNRREVHRRRRHGRVGCARRSRGRRGARRPGRARARGRGSLARPRDPGAGRRAYRRGGRDRRGREPGDGRGDLVNTAARLQSVAPPGTVLVGEATHRAASAAIAFEPAGEQLLKGKARAGPGVAGGAGRGGRRREEPERDARGPVRRSRRGAPAPQGPVPRHRARAARAAGLRHRPGGDRQEAARLGVPEVHRRSRRDRLVAPGPIAGVRRGDHVLGPGRDGPRPVRPARDRRRGRRPAPGSPRRSRPMYRTTPTVGGSSPHSCRCSGSARGPGPISCSRRGAPSSSGSRRRRRSPSCSRTSTSPTRASSTSSSSCSTGAGVRRSSS